MNIAVEYRFIKIECLVPGLVIKKIIYFSIPINENYVTSMVLSEGQGMFT